MDRVMDVNFSSLKIRTDAQPLDFLKGFVLSPLIYIRLVGIVSYLHMFSLLKFAIYISYFPSLSLAVWLIVDLM